MNLISIISSIIAVTVLKIPQVLSKSKSEEYDLQLPHIPCPNIFRYLNIDTEWIGVIELNNIQKDQTYLLVVNLAFDDYLNDNKFGKLELLYDHEKTLNHILFSNRVAYRIRFPESHHIPRVKKITLNEQIICEGQPEVYQPITTIQLDHRLKTTFTTYPIRHTVVENVKAPYFYEKFS